MAIEPQLLFVTDLFSLPNVVGGMLELIGGLVVLAALFVVVYVAAGVITVLSVWVLRQGSKLAFGLGGGDAENDIHPNQPFDRIWTELLYLSKVVRWVAHEVNFVSGRLTSFPDRPDIGRLHELRE